MPPVEHPQGKRPAAPSAVCGSDPPRVSRWDGPAGAPAGAAELLGRPAGRAGAARAEGMALSALRVSVQRLSGDVLELCVPGQSTLAELRQEIAERCGVPAEVQTLMLGADVLEGPEELLARWAPQDPEGTLALTLLVGVDGLCRDLLACGDPFEQEECLRVLADLGPRAGEPALAAVSALLRPGGPTRVRVAALETLRRVGGPGAGGAAAIEVASRSLEDGPAAVRRAAVLALGDLAAAGGDCRAQAAAAAACGLAHESACVRRASIDALAAVAVRGDGCAVSTVSGYLLGGRASTRRAALEALAVVAPPGSPEAVRAAGVCLGDEDPGVRGDASEALRLLASPGDQGAAVYARVQLRHADPGVRLLAVETLAALVRRGDPDAVELLSARLEDERPEVRKAATRALGDVVLG